MTNDNKQDKDPKNAASSEAVTENVKITNYVKCKCKSSADRITYGDVEKAIKQLAATGIEINSNTIRDHLKHGSFSTIIKHIVYAVSICHKISHQDCHDLSSKIA